MSVDCQNIPVADQAALSWAATFFPFDEKCEISSKPWGKTYQLSSSNGHAFLKILPDPLRHAAVTTPRIAQRFSGRVPEAIASDHQRGFLLLKDHGAVDFSRRPSLDQRLSMLRNYAEIQADAAGDRQLLDSHPRAVLDQAVPRLLEFLQPGSSLAGFEYGVVGAEYFLGHQEAQRYYELFACRSHLLTAHIALAKQLPDTLNHLDLRPSNAAIRPDGTCILYDWEESLAGPAGMSLHNVFHGPQLLLALLLQERDYFDPDESRDAIRLLAEYVDTLVRGGYATKEMLSQSLGSSATAGVIQFVTSFASYPTDSQSYRETLRDNIRTSLSELLDVCDFLTVHTGDPRLFDFVADYRNGDRIHRADELLVHHLHRHPLDPRALQEQGHNSMYAGRPRRAVEALTLALQVTPDNAELHTNIAQAYATRGDLESATYHVRRSLQLDPECARARELMAEVTFLHRLRELADQPGTVPMVDFTDSERTSQSMSAAKLRLCIDLFKKFGVVQLNNVFDQEILRTCHAAFLEKYQQYLKAQRHSDALTIGDKRYQVTIDFAPPFDDDTIFFNPLVLPLLKDLLGDDCILGAYTSSMSLPGAEDQDMHKDHKALFPEEDPIENLPSFAISVMIPLIDIDERVGTTRVKKGTHRLTSRQSESFATQSPLVGVGSCYLMDYRLSHHGQANQSEVARPIMNILYQRSWFRDLTNFHRQPPVRISRERYAAMSKPQQELLRWTQYPSAIVE